ncbi:MAG: CDP-diacylglycerol--glycerol-3-phosphate 3-phosphatidyltransferase [Syntrophobacteria bacterium]
MAPKRRESISNLPNSLTLFRVACVPLIVFLLFFPGKTTSFLAAILFGLASLTDLLDGFFARRRKLVTTFGKFLDPLADKLIVSASLIMLIPLDRVPAWMVVVVIGRELAITGLRGIASSGGTTITASYLGKKKMVFQTVAVLGLLLHYEYFGIDFHAVGMVFLWMAVIVTLWSGAVYFRRFWHVLVAGEGIDSGEGGET